MAGEIQLNSTTMATESSGTITLSNINSATNRTNLGLGSMATQNANSVAITGGTINTVQPATGQSLTIKDEDGNTAITIGTDNTAAGYLSLNFGSYHGDSGGAGSGSLSANTLDDYEEGTWTPTLLAASSTPQDPLIVSYISPSGYYTKVGNTVNLFCRLQTSARSGGSGTALVGGLPFAHDAITRAGGAVGYISNVALSSGYTQYGLSGDASTSTIRYVQFGDNTGASVIDITAVAGSHDVVFTYTYQTR